MKSRIKVDKQKLIECIQERKKEVMVAHGELVEAFPALMKQWESDMSGWKDGAFSALVQAKEVVESGARPSFGEYGSKLQIHHPPGKPSEPRAPDLSHFDRDIAILRMSPDDTILIGSDDYGTYVR